MSGIYRKHTNLESIAVGDEWVVLHLGQMTITKLHGLVSFIWSLLENGSGETLADIVRAVDRHYDLPDHAAEADVRALLGELIGLGLLEYRKPGTKGVKKNA
ncbi:MAG: PqqD family protein [Paenibacillaceae bacterium]|uniref:PqqD family protein n=1 Tax=Paenibacillus cymbidii TaxID=1639034 RepID=UPI001436A4C7|nr:PqqD family protein [Paenibacillus cymbidii]MBO9605740.1 PqqD family protein [Paenibacillaceae bacterium]